MRWQTLFEARWIFAVLGVGAAATMPIRRWTGWLWGGLFLYVLYFFRDPDRVASVDPKAVVAAADGTIFDIEEVEETEVLHRRMKRVGIFLSVFSVHTNRAPVDGQVTYSQEHVGQYLDARHPEATSLNAYRTWVIEGPQACVAVRQVTGAIARRIVGWSQVGDNLAKGERFGMIRFGSRTEVYLPLDAAITVQVGDKVAGGATVIARLA